MRLFTILAATAHVAILALALGGESAAQNAPDCTACAQECADNAQRCRAAAEDRADECSEPCFASRLVEQTRVLDGVRGNAELRSAVL